jgi:hypothetical protein
VTAVGVAFHVLISHFLYADEEPRTNNPGQASGEGPGGQHMRTLGAREIRRSADQGVTTSRRTVFD